MISFNSILVRLKGFEFDHTERIEPEFQFHTGSIKRLGALGVGSTL